MNLSREERAYNRLANTVLTEMFNSLKVINLEKSNFLNMLANIYSIEEFTTTRDFEIICGLALIPAVDVKNKLLKHINTLEILMKDEALNFLISTFIIHQKNKKKKEIKVYLNSKEFLRICKIANQLPEEIIQEYKESKLYEI